MAEKNCWCQAQINTFPPRSWYSIQLSSLITLTLKVQLYMRINLYSNAMAGLDVIAYPIFRNIGKFHVSGQMGQLQEVQNLQSRDVLIVS